MQHKKILIVTIPEKGHINPMIGVAAHLQAAGFELAFFAQHDIAAQLHNAGIKARMYTPPAPADSSTEFVTRGKAFVEQLADKAWLRNWIKTLLIDVVPGQAQVLKAVVGEWQPDVIVTDPMIYAAPMVANQAGIPWAGISSSLNPVTPDHWQCELTDTLHQLHPQRQALLATPEWQPAFKVSDVISPWLNIVFTVEEYMPRETGNNYFSFYTGHSFPPGNRGDETAFPFHLLQPDKKKVYMSMGSQIYYHPHLFTAVAQALPDDDIQLIFAINELYDTPFRQTLPANVIAVPYAPQLQVLPHVQLVVSHGGANSVMESLASGIPVALLPVCNDQFLQTQFVTRAGAGIVLNTQNACPQTYRQQLLPLLQPHSPVVQQAAAIGNAFRRKSGPAEAATLIQQLYHTRRPVMPQL